MGIDIDLKVAQGVLDELKAIEDYGSAYLSGYEASNYADCIRALVADIASCRTLIADLRMDLVAGASCEKSLARIVEWLNTN